MNSVDLIDLSSGKRTNIYSGLRVNILDWCFDSNGSQLAFITQDSETNQSTTLWYYRNGLNHSEKVVDSNSTGVFPKFDVTSGTLFFTTNGKYILFKLKPSVMGPAMTPSYPPGVDVWSYKDSVLQSTQLFWGKSLFAPKTEHTAVLQIGSNNVTLLEGDDERILGAYEINEFVVVGQKASIGYEWWGSLKNASTYLVSLKRR